MKNAIRKGPELLVIGTGNPGKIAELRELLVHRGLKLIGLSEFGNLPAVEETGDSFAENAAIKASSYAKLTGEWVLADDSGLVVPALGGLPGVRSARFAGENASDAENTRKLLTMMKDFSGDERSACFVCEMAVAKPSGEIAFSAAGRCIGHLARKPNGTNGFGYDPIFVPEGFEKSFGELPDEVKAGISHRSAAAAKIAAFFGDPGGKTT